VCVFICILLLRIYNVDLIERTLSQSRGIVCVGRCADEFGLDLLYDHVYYWCSAFDSSDRKRFVPSFFG